MPGTIEGTGTYFEVNDSNYLNVSVESSEPVYLRLESVPEMVVMEIEAANDVNSTQITLGGFDPNTTYYKYEDDYHNLMKLTTGSDGSAAYTQDLKEPHLVFIQPRASTIYISDSGWSDPAVGTWDRATKTGTLTQDLTETIQIDSNGITLDGGGHTITGTKTGYGVYLSGRTGVAVKNLNVQGFTFGIYLHDCSHGMVTENTVSNNKYYGVYLSSCSDSTLTDNTISDNSTGVSARTCSNSTLMRNTVSSNASYGIYLLHSGGSIMRNNIMAGNRFNFGLFSWADADLDNDIDVSNTVDGKRIYYVKGATGAVYDSSTNAGAFYAVDCNNITIKHLMLTKNGHGIFLWKTPNSRIENVIATDNAYGMMLFNSSKSTLTGNNASNNGASGIEFHQSGNSSLAGNTASYNGATGIDLLDSGGSSLIGNTASNNQRGPGIRLSRSSDSTLTNNTANSNGFGISLWHSGGGTMRNNTMICNRYNFAALGTADSHFDHDIDTSNLVEGKPVYYVRGAGGVVYDSSTNAGAFYAINCDGITVKDLTLTKNYHGIFLWKTQNSRVENVVASNNYYGIQLWYSNNNTLADSNASSNIRDGIYVLNCGYNTLTRNTASSNGHDGIYVRLSSGDTLVGNTANSNYYHGIFIDASSGSTLMGNTANSNSEYYGIRLTASIGCTLRGNTMTCNRWNFHVDGSHSAAAYDHDVDTTNMVEGKPVYYVKNAVGEVYDSSTNAGTFYAINCDDITIKDLTLNKDFAGVFLYRTHNSRIRNVVAYDNFFGIRLFSSNNNTVTCNTVSNNYYWGIELSYSGNNMLTCNTVSWTEYGEAMRLRYSNGNTLTGNTAWYNKYGIKLDRSNYNEVYNNNFVDNGTQAHVSSDSTGNIFNLSELEGGGNYWSNWTSPDNDGNGFVDYPYVFSGGQDNLPLVSEALCVCNEAPAADAGADQSVHPGTVVTLDGSGSSDPDENYPLSYSWQITSMPEGSMTVLQDANTVNPTFVPDVMGNYTIELVVSDSLGVQSAPDTVLVSTYNTAPVADAGPDQAIIELDTIVQLDGTQSWDYDGDDFTYLWTMTHKPAESLAELSDPYSPTPDFVADVHGDYVISLTVTDVFGAVSDPAATVTISFTNVKPVADAGGSQAVIVGETVLLDGSDSNDQNHDPLSYNWSFVSKPADSIADFDDCNSVQASFVADQVGTYIVSLVVNDGFVDSEPANVTIEAISCVDAGVQTLLDAIVVINDLPEDSLKNVKMKTPLTNKINGVLGKVENGFCGEAVDKLQHDILQKMNGCAEISEPDRNDWLITCEAQDQVYPLIISAMELLDKPDCTCF
jgi:parallel beta-helix repeat protein